MLDGFLDHLLHVGIVDIDGGFHFHDFLLAGFDVAREDVEDAVGVDLELHADARHAFGRGLEVES